MEQPNGQLSELPHEVVCSAGGGAGEDATTRYASAFAFAQREILSEAALDGTEIEPLSRSEAISRCPGCRIRSEM